MTNDFWEGRVLAIDDTRECLSAQILCRTYDDGVKALQLLGPWDLLELDHDLGSSGTGYDIAKFLILRPELRPKRILIISSNPVGVENIANALFSAGYDTLDVASQPRRFYLK